jgi:acyl-coenzyme A synthetase/AMP-(fatty) acid ligase
VLARERDRADGMLDPGVVHSWIDMVNARQDDQSHWMMPIVTTTPRLEQENSLGLQQVQDYLLKKLAKFKIPRVVEFRNTLPREDTRKIFKRRLQEEYAMRQQRRQVCEPDGL